MKRMKTSQVRDQLGSVVNRVAYGKERIVLERRNTAMAAIIPMEDLRLLERLIGEEAQRDALEKSREAKAVASEQFPLEGLMEELGIDKSADGSAAGRKGSKGKPGKK